VLVGELVHQ
jgi:hypothetical protein